MAKVTKITPTSEVLEHINSQTFGADASAAMAEPIPTFGYSEQGNSGMLLVGAWWMGPVHDTGLFGGINANPLSVQILSGDQSATPAVVNADDNTLIAGYEGKESWVTGGHEIIVEYPKPLFFFRPTPVIVAQEFTIVWDAVNQAIWNTKEMFVVLHFMTVAIPSEMYMRLLMDQQRRS